MNTLPLHSRAKARHRQRGVVLLFSLITLVVLLIAAVALVRSFSDSMFTAGNIAFKRDLQNQSDRVMPAIITLFTTGDLATPSARGTSQTKFNYSATILPSNSFGVPNALLDDTAFAAVGVTSNDIPVYTLSGKNQQITIRYVIDRLCDATGDDSTLGSGRCVLIDTGAPQGGSASQWPNADSGGPSGTGGSAVPQQLVYRVSVKVTGPRNTQAFFQTTFGD